MILFILAYEIEYVHYEQPNLLAIFDLLRKTSSETLTTIVLDDVSLSDTFDAFIEFLHASPKIHTIVCQVPVNNAAKRIAPILSRIKSLRISVHSQEDVEEILQACNSSKGIKDLSIWGGGKFSAISNQHFEQILPKLKKIDLRGTIQAQKAYLLV